MNEQPTLVQRLAEAVPGWGARVAYGQKEIIDGKEMVPVALSGFGFGAGEGSGAVPSPAQDSTGGTGEGSGGGGGGFALPIGAYVARGDEVRFEPNPVAVLVATAPAMIAIATAAACAIATIGSARAFSAIFSK